MTKTLIGQAILSGLLSAAIVMIVKSSIQNNLTAMYAVGFVFFIWLCFIVPTIGSNILWGNYPKDIVWKKFLSDILYNLITIILIAGLVMLFV